MQRRRLVVDVSNNNPIGTTELRASGALALICKCTQGTTFVDDTYDRHRAVAHDLHLPFGAYTFLTADAAGSEADYLLEHAKPQPGDLQPIVDAERGRPRPEAERAWTCLTALDAAGYRPLLYSSWSYLLSMLREVPQLARFRVWEAAYTPLRLPVRHGCSVVCWQFTDRYKLGGRRFDASRLLVPLDTLRIP